MNEEADRAPGTSLLFDVYAVNQAVARLLGAAMRDGPLTPAEYAVYSAIFELEAASPTRIADRLGVRLTTCMDQLRTILERGHARRVGNPADRRSYRVVLTNEGLAAHRAANRTFEAAHSAFARELQAAGPDAEAAARRGLALIRDAANRAFAAASVDPATPSTHRRSRTTVAASRPRSASRAG